MQNNELKDNVDLSAYLLAVEKYKKVENINTQNDFETTSKKWTEKRKQICSLCFVEVFKFQEKQVQGHSKEFLRNYNTNKKTISWKSHQSQWSLHDKYGWSKVKDWQ